MRRMGREMARQTPLCPSLSLMGDRAAGMAQRMELAVICQGHDYHAAVRTHPRLQGGHLPQNRARRRRVCGALREGLEQPRRCSIPPSATYASTCALQQTQRDDHGFLSACELRE